LRDVVRNAVDVLSNALGSGGSTNLNEILNYQPVKTAVAAQKHCPVQINAHFLRQNADAFVVFFRDGQLRVKTRLEDQDAEGRNAPAADLSEEVTEDLIFEVQELLAAYKAPNSKKSRVPEPPWVPARAILSRPQCARLEGCLSRCAQSKSVESCYDSEDGLLLRLVHHPRAPDHAEYMERSVQGLAREAVEIDADEARRRLGSDDKFMQFWKLLRAVEINSPEEMAIAGNLRARMRIHAHAHRLATRISADAKANVSWEEAKSKLEQVKWYRQVLAFCLDSPGESLAEEELEDCLTSIAKAWPDVETVQASAKKRRVYQQARSEAKRARSGRGKN